MGTYIDFLRQHDKEDSKVRRLYWIYGEEEVFRLLTVRRLRDLFGAEPFNTTVLSAMDTPEPEIWAALNQHPLESSHRRVLIVHEAHRIETLSPMIEWLKDPQTTRAANTLAIFVSSEKEWDAPEREAVGKTTSASYVKCSLPNDPEDRLKRVQKILTSWGDIDYITAGVLAKRVNFDMVQARAVMDKVALFPEARVTPGLVELLAPRRVEDDLIWSLLSLNKQKAVEAVVEGDVGISVSTILGTLATHVTMLGRIHPVLTTAKTAKEVAHRIEAREQYVRRLMPYARLYPRASVVSRLHLLVRLDHEAQQGSKDGILESLIALW